MPRQVTTGSETQRQRQRRYRTRLRSEGRPEASLVDIAVAGAVAEYWLRLQRMAAEGQIAMTHPGETVAAVSHGDVIRSIIAQVACIPLDAIDRFEVMPASVAIIELGNGWQRLRALNAAAPGITFAL